MSSVVFILGAGASKQCGAPLMNEFLDTAFSLWKTGVVSEKKEHFERVFKAISSLQRVHSKSQLDLINIESIFTAFEIANVLGKLPGFNKEEIPEVINSLKEVIVATLEQTIMYPVVGTYIKPAEPYNSFAVLIKHLRSDAHPAQSVSVITFNYDIALDMALHSNGFGPDYCIKVPPANPKDIPLLKLHGSLNWASHSETGEVTPLELDRYFKKYSITDPGYKTCHVPISTHIQKFFSDESTKVDAAPVIVPPTWNKADYHKTLEKVWARAATELADAASIFIIGYSLPKTDEFFRLLYGLGTVGDTLLQRVVVYNPDTSGEVEERFRLILGSGALARFKYNPLRFDEAVQDIKNMFPKKKY